MLDLPENCLELLADSETLEDRRRIAEVCLRHIAQYFDRYDYLAHRADRAMQCAPSVHSNFAEKAFEMEKHVRVISALALDTLNDLRDSGALQRIYGQAVDEARSNPSFFRAALEAAKADLQKLCPTVRKNVLDEAFGIAQAFTVNVHAHYPRLVLSVTGFDREERHVVIDATPGPGKPGRVDTRNFFSSASTMPVGSRPLPIVEKSQNKAQQQRGKETEEDLYAGIISGLPLDVNSHIAMLAKLSGWVFRRYREVKV